MDRSGAIVAELRLVVREIATMPARRDQNAAAVDQAEQSWEFQFGSSSHDELLFSEDRQLADERDRDATPYEQLITERCRILTGFVDELLSGIQLVVETDLSQNQQEIIRLGMLVDEAIHPQPVYRYMHFEREGGEAAAPLSWEHPNGVERACRRSLPSLPVTVPNDWPDQRWLQEVEQRLLHFGLLPNQLSEIHSRSATDDRLIQVIEQLLIRELAARTGTLSDCDAVAGVNLPIDIFAVSPGAQSVADRLGILLDTRQSRASRNGSEMISFAPRLFALLLHFLERDAEPTTLDWFTHNWRRIVPESESHNRNTVYDAIHRLGSVIDSMGLTIEHRPRGGGYFLQDNRASLMRTDPQS